MDTKKCKDFELDVTNYISGDYQAIKDYNAFFQHLRQCPACRQELLETEAIFGRFSEVATPSPEFTKKMAEIREMAKKGPRPLTETEKKETPLKLGITLYKKQNWLKAKEVFDEAVTQSPQDANVYYHRGLALQRMNHLTQAIMDFTKAIELDPEDADAYYHRGKIYQRQEQLGLALKDYARSIQLNPDYAESYNNRGWLYGGINKPHEALLDFNKAVELMPNEAIVYHGRGKVLGVLGQVDEAISDFNKVLKLLPDKETAYYDRGVAYARKGEFKKAMSDLKKTLQLRPDFALALDARKKVEQELITRQIMDKIKKADQQIARQYQKDKDRLKTKYEAEIKQLQAKIKHLEETQKMLLDIAKQKPEYHYHITSQEAPGIIAQPRWDRPEVRAISRLTESEEKE